MAQNFLLAQIVHKITNESKSLLVSDIALFLLILTVGALLYSNLIGKYSTCFVRLATISSLCFTVNSAYVQVSNLG